MRKDEKPSNCESNLWTKLQKDCGIRMLKLAYIVQQDAAIKYYVFKRLKKFLHVSKTM
jgi:hypothetical protein